MNKKLQLAGKKNQLATGQGALALDLFAAAHFKKEAKTPAWYSINHTNIRAVIDRIVVHNMHYIRISPDQRFVCMASDHSLYLWKLPSLKFIGKYPLEHSSDMCTDNTGSKVYALRTICFIGNNHVAAGYANGYLEVLDIRNGAVMLNEKIGGWVECMTASSKYLAVSLFAVNDFDRSVCGITIFDIPTLLHKKALRMVEGKFPE